MKVNNKLGTTVCPT